MSYRRFAALLVAASLGGLAAPHLAMAQANPVEEVANAITGQHDEDHLAQAVSHAREAVGGGADRNAASLTEHASAALEHASAAQAAEANQHTAAGVTHLEQAVAHGRKGHVKIAKKHAEEALTHLSHAQETSR